MRTLVAALFLGFSSISSAMALSGATADSGDRFPFAVEVKYQEKLICSGTVLFPRIVVTAAHACSRRSIFAVARSMPTAICCRPS
jgi:secreted trypsin-like serine protease